MYKECLGILFSTPSQEVLSAQNEKRLDNLRSSVFKKTCCFLDSFKGKSIEDYRVPEIAYKQKTYELNGVVFGESDPGLFLYYLTRGVCFRMSDEIANADFQAYFGFYSFCHERAALGPAEEDQVLMDLEQYALSIVEITYQKNCPDSHLIGSYIHLNKLH